MIGVVVCDGVEYQLLTSNPAESLDNEALRDHLPAQTAGKSLLQKRRAGELRLTEPPLSSMLERQEIERN